MLASLEGKFPPAILALADGSVAAVVRALGRVCVLRNRAPVLPAGAGALWREATRVLDAVIVAAMDACGVLPALGDASGAAPGAAGLPGDGQLVGEDDSAGAQDLQADYGSETADLVDTAGDTTGAVGQNSRVVGSSSQPPVSSSHSARSSADAERELWEAVAGASCDVLRAAADAVPRPESASSSASDEAFDAAQARFVARVVLPAMARAPACGDLVLRVLGALDSLGAQRDVEIVQRCGQGRKRVGLLDQVSDTYALHCILPNSTMAAICTAMPAAISVTARVPARFHSPVAHPQKLLARIIEDM